ncbi:type IV pilus twitching motility protein PilT [Oscillibacter sp.]|uniref:type IV pilus twitching motility protein PilT n=1 Tax=Oscillibacter sp. TaxID=1945593 RepID=UPI0026022AB4|nr:type IV pilus twitching motility protein PilT [Oscillibacter sp.]MDD3347411.1 type IV pilus twitching motility protein PilT [Oscillibacter sp.]
MQSFEELIASAISMRASDLHLSVAIPPTVRVDGELTPMGETKCTPDDVRSVAESIMNERQKETLAECGEVDFAYSSPQVGRFRINIFRQRGSIAMAVRVLNLRIPTPRELGIPQVVVDLCAKKRGLVLVTGATGSGKSTTLASLINVINETYTHHIITLEDPIEYLHKHRKSIVNQREMGSDSRDYASALRAALRQDPDVILAGEMRDLETISIAVTAAETGHLVFSTLHTVGAANTIDRIIDVFPPYQQQQIRTQLADVLECVVSQQLVPNASGKGRVAAIEVMLSNSAVRNNIRESKTFQIHSVMQTNRKIGMCTMDDALLDLFRSGAISREDALSFAQDRPTLAKRLL